MVLCINYNSTRVGTRTAVDIYQVYARNTAIAVLTMLVLGVVPTVAAA